MSEQANKSDILRVQDSVDKGMTRIDKQLEVQTENSRQNFHQLFELQRVCAKDKNGQIGELKVKQEGLSVRMKILFAVVAALGVGVVSIAVKIVAGIFNHG